MHDRIVMDITRFCLQKTRVSVLFVLCCAAVAAAGVIGTPCAHAHPHLFIEQQLEIVFDEQGLSGIRVRWKFDDMFSSMVIQDYDVNRNGRFEPSEVRVIENKAFSLVSEYGYFTFIKIDNVPFPIRSIRHFNAGIENHQVIYEFFIPCRVEAAPTMKKVSVASYDPTYYTAIMFSDENPVVLRGADGFDVKTSVREDPDTKIYFDMIHPWTLFMEFRKKS